MSRRQAQAGLNATVDRSRITLLHGLPRVGRSVLLAAWCDERSGVQRIRPTEVAGCSAPLQVLEALSAQN